MLASSALVNLGEAADPATGERVLDVGAGDDPPEQYIDEDEDCAQIMGKADDGWCAATVASGWGSRARVKRLATRA